jgi:hypothetical protein
MSKQTALEWFVEQVESISNSKGVSRTETIQLYNDAIQKAKAMEKEQIIDTRQDGVDVVFKGYSISNEEYYHETYGGDK